MSQTEANASSSLIAPLLLVAATLCGLILANSPAAGWFSDILNKQVLFNIGSNTVLDKSILLLVNDGLMAIFFLYVGLELKRELVLGELSSKRKAMLPAFAAIGGMVVPALLYFFVTAGTPAAAGWGIPMATDIAFALGVLTILGNRVPLALKVLLVAIAIVDDLGAIMVIGLFYTSELNLLMLSLAGGFLALAFLMNRMKVTSLFWYTLIGIPVWYFTLKSGIHATIAGVAMAFAIPLGSEGKENTQEGPGLWLEHALVVPVTFLIIPIFALANSGIPLIGLSVGHASLGIALGLAVGKPLGVLGGAYLGKKLGLVEMPDKISWTQIAGIGCLAGIGFTMSLFINSLAFTDVALLNEAKLAIVVTSFAIGTIGFYMLRESSKERSRLKRLSLNLRNI